MDNSTTLRWVKANDRNPNENGSYFCKCKNRWSEWIGGYVEFYEGDWQDNHPAPTGVLEWLEEYIPEVPQKLIDLLHRAHKNNTHDMGWDEDYQNLIEQLNNQ